MELNKLPVKTFNHIGLNEVNLDYNPGTYEDIDFSKDGILNLSGGKDTKVSIDVKENESLSIIMNYEAVGTLNVNTGINIARNGELKLIQIDASEEGNRLINEVNANVSEDGRLNIIQILPGRGDVYTEAKAELTGNRSEYSVDVAYLTRKNQVTDMNYIANHKGKETVCDIQAAGVLRDEGKKNFRATIDFKTGSSGSKGKENEKVLLLSEEAINGSIPIILCTEEDVEGSHGCQIGSLSDEILLYFNQRGIDKAEAEKMISYGNFNRLIRQIDDDELREKTDKLVSEVL
ncbi:MAG: SufD family Fe-S cluster assembly protein [Lachnospiraceae bacterium]|nr:SufD family Fe-S cluster assembly protein [Lachnospiraceae bacterium]